MTSSVVVTGIGAASGFGNGTEALWRAVCAGTSSIGALRLFDTGSHRTGIAAEVPAAALPSSPPGLGRADRFACAAGTEACAGLDPAALRSVRAGVFFGSSTGGLFEGERYYRDLRQGGGRRLRAIASQENNGPGDALARRFGVRGPVLTVSTACTSATVALAFALDALQSGEIDVALAGGADELCEITYAGFNALRAVDPAHTRPFRQSRAGLSMGEGSGVLLLETARHAALRGATVFAELVGAGRSCDAHHVSAPDPAGAGAAAAIRGALAAAGATPDEVTFVNAHGTGTPHNDDAEAQAMRAVFGARCASLPITSTKSATGHLLGAAGGIEAVLTVLSLVHRLLPPTIAPLAGATTCSGEPVDPALGLDVVTGGPRELPEHNLGLSTNLAFGGNNCAVLLRSPGRR